MGKGKKSGADSEPGKGSDGPSSTATADAVSASIGSNSGKGLKIESTSDAKISSSKQVDVKSTASSGSSSRVVSPGLGGTLNPKALLGVVMQQNSQLEREIQRLHAEIDEITKGVLKRGFLYKFREREISFASKWALRYFVLQGKTISYFADDKDLRPRRSFDVTGCIVKDEGPTKGGAAYHVFSIYYPVEIDPHAVSMDDDHSEDDNAGGGGLVGSLLLRLSSESKAEAAQWIATLRKACAKDVPILFARLPDYSHIPDTAIINSPINSISAAISSDASKDADDNKIAEDWAHASLDEIEDALENAKSSHQIPKDVEGIAKETLERMRASTLVLQQSLSRSSLVSVDEPKYSTAAEIVFTYSGPTPRPMSPDVTAGLKVSRSGRSLIRLAEGANHDNKHGAGTATTTKSDKKRRFPASKPIHVGSRFSPLSAESRPSEQNYRGFFNLVRKKHVYLS
jgi:hypothetical protein